MAIQSSYYTTDGTTRTYPSSKHIASKLHVAVYLQTTLTSSWGIVESSQYDIVNNSIVFYTAPVETIYSQIEIRVADTTAELEDSPSDIAIVAGAITDVINVSNNTPVINNVNTNMGAITTVSANIDNVNTLGGGISSGVIPLYNSTDKALFIKNNDALLADKTIIYLDNVDELSKVTVASNGDVAIVSDILRGGIFEYDNSVVGNGGTIIGKWVRQFSGDIDVRWFGAKGDGVTDDTYEIQTAIGYATSIKGLSVTGNGLVYNVTSPIYLTGTNRTVLKDIVLTCSVALGATNAVLIIGNTSNNDTPTISNQHSVQNVKVLCNHIVENGIKLNSSGAGTTLDNFYIHGFTQYGLWCKASGDGLNDSKVTNGNIQEWEWASSGAEYPGYSDYSNRTGIGVYIDNVADMVFVNVTSNLCKEQLSFNGECYSNKFIGCTFWANKDAIGVASARLIHIPKLTAFGTQFTGCRFDDASIHLYQFDQIFTGCKFIQVAPAIKLLTVDASTSVDYLTISGCHFTSTGGVPIQTSVSGAGSFTAYSTWKSTIVGNIGKYGDYIIGTHHNILGAGLTTSSTNIVQGDVPYQGIAANTWAYQAHSTTNVGIGLTRWAAGTTAPVIAMGKSRSTTTGTFGGYPLNNDLLGTILATGDNGTGFSTAGITGVNARIEFKAAENWTATANGSSIHIATTTIGTSTSAVRLVIDNFGIKPSSDNAISLGTSSVRYSKVFAYQVATKPYTVATLPPASTAGAGARAYVTDATTTTFASIVAGGGSNGVPVYSNGTNWLIG